MSVIISILVYTFTSSWMMRVKCVGVYTQSINRVEVYEWDVDGSLEHQSFLVADSALKNKWFLVADSSLKRFIVPH